MGATRFRNIAKEIKIKRYEDDYEKSMKLFYNFFMCGFKKKVWIGEMFYIKRTKEIDGLKEKSKCMKTD